MDRFGIGQSVIGFVRAFIETSRGTGRTTSFVKSLNPGDRVICATPQEANEVMRHCRMRGLAVDVMVIDPRQIHSGRLLERGPAAGVTLFHHGWLEQYYTGAIQAAVNEVSQLQEMASSYSTFAAKTPSMYIQERFLGMQEEGKKTLSKMMSEKPVDMENEKDFLAVSEMIRSVGPISEERIAAIMGSTLSDDKGIPKTGPL